MHRSTVATLVALCVSLLGSAAIAQTSGSVTLTPGFMPDPQRLWQAVLRRQGGELALVSTYPDDPRLN